MDKFRLEFNESNQQFHLDNYTHDENTHGWTTVAKSVSDKKATVFFKYFNRLGLKNQTTKDVKKIFKDCMFLIKEIKKS